VVRAVDPFDGRVEDEHSAGQDVVLVRLHVAGADADEGMSVDG
jgi:hypothetical protein